MKMINSIQYQIDNKYLKKKMVNRICELPWFGVKKIELPMDVSRYRETGGTSSSNSLYIFQTSKKR